MSSTRHSRVIVLGSGPAGYTAAIYAARAMVKPLVIAGTQPGGQLTITTDVENYPGFAKGIQGPQLMDDMRAQAEHMGAEVINDTITSVTLKSKPIKLVGDSGVTYTCDALIIATGAQAKWLGLPSEQHFQGFGVSACATCDGFFYRGKKVLVVGGGNTAVEEAIFLTNFASEVTVIHRRNEFKAEKVMQNRLFAHPKIKVIWDTELADVVGEHSPKSVHTAKLRNVKTGAETLLPVDGIFVAIGHKPSTELFEGQLPFKNGGYLVTEGGWTTQTAIPGVFAAGDVTDDVYRQAVTAAGMGCMAALEAEKYLHAQDSIKQAAE
ncbi:thioredoxin-disulfide reductase [Aestuariivirga litoralis]|uniref:thioredoxin-disulfide reductase n=1 Tax=Aestuariivirga litoralis TaxID=2650924 RepID=UPI0018C55D93|nr:thioredoxin-disulfide reductase [Aestuariivirga litoralis]MBG1231036.1 thioredoxin-disulfide reductase [Aestuariivirga litoralis]